MQAVLKKKIPTLGSGGELKYSLVVTKGYICAIKPTLRIIKCVVRLPRSQSSLQLMLSLSREGGSARGDDVTGRVKDTLSVGLHGGFARIA